MTSRLDFTQEALPPAPSRKQAYYNDTRLPGLQRQVTDKGIKTFYVYRRVHNRPTRIKPGRFPNVKAAKAHDQAKITIGQVAAVQNPRALNCREAAERITLSNAFGEYVKVRSLRSKTVYDHECIIEMTFADREKKRLNRITTDMIAKRPVNYRMRQDVTAGHIGTDMERLREPMQQICDCLLKAGNIKEGKIISLSTGGPTRA